MATAYIKLNGETSRTTAADEREFTYAWQRPGVGGWFRSDGHNVVSTGARNEHLGYDPRALDSQYGYSEADPKVPHGVITIGQTMGPDGPRKIAYLDGEPVDLNTLNGNYQEVTQDELAVGAIIVAREVHMVPIDDLLVGSAAMRTAVVVI